MYFSGCLLTTSINDIGRSKQIQIYPNPFTDKLTISNINGFESFLLVNQLGQIIYDGKQIEQQNFSGLTNGIYFLTISTTNNVQTYKIIKQY